MTGSVAAVIEVVEWVLVWLAAERKLGAGDRKRLLRKLDDARAGLGRERG